MCEKATQKAGEAIDNKYTLQKYQIRPPNEKYRLKHACKYNFTRQNRLVGVVWEEGVYETGVVQYTDIGKEAEIKIGTNTKIQTHKY